MSRLWLYPVLITLVLMFLFPATAQARPRDEAMSVAYRCNVVGDDRPWLDCFYGAAQAVRAQLGLPQPSAAQISIANAPPIGGSALDVGHHSEALAIAARCYTITDDRAWLDCYYAAADPVRMRLGLAVTSQSRISKQQPEGVKPPASASNNTNIFSVGSDHRVVSRMTAYSFDRYGIFTVSLANAQVWQQQPGDTAYARWKKAPGEYTVTITEGALGSLNLEVKGEPHVFKVQLRR